MNNKSLALAQLILNSLALVYCLWVFPLNIVIKRRWKHHTLNTFHLIITICMLIQQSVMLVEVIIHFCYLQQILDFDWRTGRRLSLVVEIVGIPLYGLACSCLLFYVGQKYKNMIIPTTARYRRDLIHTTYVIVVLFALYMICSFLFTDSVDADLYLHRILGACLFTLWMVFIIGIIEMQLVKTIFKQVRMKHRMRARNDGGSHTQLDPMRGTASPHSSQSLRSTWFQDVSKTMSRRAKIKLIALISFMMLMGCIAVGLYVWSDLKNDVQDVNYYASMALSVAAWDSNQVVFL